jgi:hypothetical protein
MMTKEIIPKYPTHKDEYLEAIRTWRHPFWDWAKNPRMPKLARHKRITLKIGGGEESIDNPLYQFKMPNDKRMGVYGVGKIAFPDGDAPLDVGDSTGALYLYGYHTTNTLVLLVWRLLCHLPLSNPRRA